jgi:hypothetical protein
MLNQLHLIARNEKKKQACGESKCLVIILSLLRDLNELFYSS